MRRRPPSHPWQGSVTTLGTRETAHARMRRRTPCGTLKTAVRLLEQAEGSRLPQSFFPRAGPSGGAGCGPTTALQAQEVGYSNCLTFRDRGAPRLRHVIGEYLGHPRDQSGLGTRRATSSPRKPEKKPRLTVWPRKLDNGEGVTERSQFRRSRLQEIGACSPNGLVGPNVSQR